MKKKNAQKETKEVRKVEFKYSGRRVYRFSIDVDSEGHAVSALVFVDGKEHDLQYACDMLGTARVKRMIEKETERQTR